MEIFVFVFYVKFNKIVSFCFGIELLFYKDKLKVGVFLIMVLICLEIKRIFFFFKNVIKWIFNKYKYEYFIF